MSFVERPFSQAEMSRKVLLTSSFPYAGSPLCFDQLLDTLQADIHARFLRLVGREAVFICAADSHGTEVQRNAAAAGVEPETLARRFSKEHERDFKALHIEFSSFTATHGEVHRELIVRVFNRLNEKGYLYEREIPLGYCGRCRRFLPSRFDRGRCPGCGALVRAPGLCRLCSGLGQQTEPHGEGCPDCGTKPETRLSRHYFFRLSEFSGRLASWVRSGGGLQPEVEQWVTARLQQGLDDWCISRDGPYFGYPVPGELNKFFCVWLDAPLGYLSGSEHCWHDGRSEIVQFVRRDIIAFHTLFWPAVLMGADFSLPDRIVSQGFLTIDGQRVSRTHRPAFEVRELTERVDPECLRYLVASRLGSGLAEVNLGPAVWDEAVNVELGEGILRYIQQTLARPAEPGGGAAAAPIPELLRQRYLGIGAAYAGIDFRSALAGVRDLTGAAGTLGPGQPWGPALCRDLAILLKPVLPRLGREVQELLGAERAWCWDDLGTPFSGRVEGTVDSLIERLTGGGGWQPALQAGE